MITIKKKEFDRLLLKHPDYVGRAIARHEHDGKVCEIGDYCGFESVITGDTGKGSSLIFQHIHFEIID